MNVFGSQIIRKQAIPNLVNKELKVLLQASNITQ